MADQVDIAKLRRMLGEPVPEGGTDDDTLFADEVLASLIDSNPNLEAAALEGWREKAANLSSLVDSSEGNTQRKFGQLLTNAEKMVRIYSRHSGGPTEGRARVGSIRRRQPINLRGDLL